MPTLNPPLDIDAQEGASQDDASLVDLGNYRNPEYDPGRGLLVRALWYVISLVVFESGWFPFRRLKAPLLRWFGAKLGQGVRIKPHVRIKYPWRFTAGEHCWIGQEVWIDNVSDVQLGSHVCLSQRVYLCTGSHDHRSPGFELITKPIRIGNGAWLGAGCLIVRGLSVGANSLVAGGSVVTKDVPPAMIVAGNPAKPIGPRYEQRQSAEDAS
jgi:putative colanic acid biosynthesis acetyltransferase WcaF